MKSRLASTIGLLPAAAALLLVSGVSGAVPADDSASGVPVAAQDTLLVPAAFHADLGEVSMTGPPIHRTVEVTNRSETAVEIIQAASSCMCTDALLIFEDESILGPFGMGGHGPARRVGRMVAPGEQFKVRLRMDIASHPTARPGDFRREVRIVASRTAPVILALEGTLVP